MYVPTLALQILSHNKAGKSSINLKGIMVRYTCRSHAMDVACASPV